MPSMVRSIDMKLCGSVQGAAEIVIAKCDSFLDANGQRAALTEEKRTEILGIITQMAQEGLRTLCLSFRDFDSSADAESPVFDLPPEENLTACCIVGIKVRSKTMHCPPATASSLLACYVGAQLLLLALPCLLASSFLVPCWNSKTAIKT